MFSKRMIITGIITVSAVMTGGAVAAAMNTGGGSFQEEACVHFGQAGSSAGNVMDYDWNDSICPPGTYMVHLAQYPDADPTPTVTVTQTVTPSPSPSSTVTSTPTPVPTK